MIPQENIGAGLHAVSAGAPHSQATSGAQVGLTVSSATGDIIDRNALPRRYLGAKIVVPYRATVSSGKAVTVGYQLKTRSATSGVGSSWANVTGGAGSGSVSKVGSTTTFNGRTMLAGDVSLAPCERYVRLNTTKVFNSTASGAAGANVTVEAPVLILGGANQNPAAG